jgi:hypothetical protein
MVDKPALHYVNELVVTAGRGWQKEESGVNQIMYGVVYDTLYDFTIAELAAHPYAMDDGRPGMEIQFLVIRVPLEVVYVENGLDIRS